MTEDELGIWFYGITMGGGFIAGVIYAIISWNDNDVDSISIFYAIFAWWLVAPLLVCAAIGLSPLFLGTYIIKLLRPEQ